MALISPGGDCDAHAHRRARDHGVLVGIYFYLNGAVIVDGACVSTSGRAEAGIPGADWLRFVALYCEKLRSRGPAHMVRTHKFVQVAAARPLKHSALTALCQA